MSSCSLPQPFNQEMKDSLDLTNKKLEVFPIDDLSKLNTIKFCYLEGNSLSQLPGAFFSTLPMLEWLDLRNNNLTYIATDGLAGHQNLQVMLLRNNRIKVLPSELAFVPRLRGLQIAGNPIENVPFDIISGGIESVLNHLRKERGGKDSMPTKTTSDAVIKNFICTSRENAVSSVPRAKSISRESNGSSIGRRDVCMRRLSKERCIDTAKSKALLKKSCSRLVTPEAIEISRQEQDAKARLREMLERQAQLLQRIKDVEALKDWRKLCHVKRSSKFLDNFQYSPSQSCIDKSPFDVDPDMFHMLNRADIYKSLKEWEDYQQRRAQAKSSESVTTTNVWDLEQKIARIKGQLEALNLNDIPKEADLNQSDDFHMEMVASRICQINKLRQVLLKLREENLKVM